MLHKFNWIRENETQGDALTRLLKDGWIRNPHYGHWWASNGHSMYLVFITGNNEARSHIQILEVNAFSTNYFELLETGFLFKKAENAPELPK